MSPLASRPKVLELWFNTSGSGSGQCSWFGPARSFQLSCRQVKGRVLTWGLWMRSLVHHTRSPPLQHRAHGPKPVLPIWIKEAAKVVPKWVTAVQIMLVVYVGPCLFQTGTPSTS